MTGFPICPVLLDPELLDRKKLGKSQLLKEEELPICPTQRGGGQCPGSATYNQHLLSCLRQLARKCQTSWEGQKKRGETLRNEECSRKILCHLFDARWSLQLTCTGRAAPACAQLGNRKQWAVTPRLAQAHSFVTTLKRKEDQDKNLKHCKRHNGPEVRVHITSSYTNLQISISDSRLQSIKFKISTKHQYLDL